MPRTRCCRRCAARNSRCLDLPRLHDVLHGVVANDDRGRVTPAERVRFVHHLLTMPAHTEAALGPGAALTLRSEAFPHLVDFFPLHDPSFNAAWTASWSQLSLHSWLMGIDDAEIDKLRAYLGEEVALYFAFLSAYFVSLFPVAVLGLVFWLSGEAFDGMYSVLLVAWACTFVGVWRIREKKWAVRWGTAGLGYVDQPRTAFQPHTMVRDSVTGAQNGVFEWWRRESRMLASIPVALVFVVMLVGTLTFILFLEVSIAELYNGPAQQFVPLIPTILFSTCIPAIQSLWRAVAERLTTWENHETLGAHNASLTLKIFAMQALVTYGGLILTAFVYIPFGKEWMHILYRQGYLLPFLRWMSGQTGATLRTSLAFEVHPVRMYNQLFALTVTAQVINAAQEVVVPLVMRVGARWIEQASRALRSKKAKPTSATDPSEASFLEHVQAQLALPTYDLFGDYAELATQLGNIILWSSIWPLATVMAYVNNWFELRSDAYKIVLTMRRPVPQRAESIGPWLEVCAFLVRLAVFMNAALVYLYDKDKGGEPVMRTTAATHFSVFALAPRTSPVAALAAAVVFALLCEQVYSVAQSALGHVLTRSLWKGSTEEVTVRRRQYESRTALARSLSRAEERQAPLYATAPQALPPFWDASHNDGVAYWSTVTKVA